MELRAEIVALVKNEVVGPPGNDVSVTGVSRIFREPLVGFASADDPLFGQLKEIVGSHHVHPHDVLPEAKTVVAFFVPFSREVVLSNRHSNDVSPEWAKAYLAANATINTVSEKLVEAMADKSIKAATIRATHTYDAETLTATWSHRSVAYITGLGRFGLNRMLITSVGCAGRYGSVIISQEVTPDSRPEEESCLYYKTGQCRFCVSNCPTQALTVSGIDRHKCNSHLLKVSEGFSQWGLCDVCGKCVVGPCAMLG